MSQIRYEEWFVSDERIKSLVDSREEVKGTRRAYALYRALNHYWSLKSHQGQRQHWGYISGVTTAGLEEVYCTCGMVVQDSFLKTVQVRHGLEPIQLLSGHVRMPENEGYTAAFITGFKWVEARRNHTWKVFCQGCELYLEELTFHDATEWVLAHEGHLS